MDLIINAGGQSRRMGQNKALLSIPATGEPQIVHVVQRLRTLPCQRTIIVADHHNVLQPHFLGAVNLLFLPDAYPGTGALGGVASGLAVCDDWAVVVACDMPLVNPAIFRYLITLAHETDESGVALWDAVIPKVAAKYQSFHALYHPRCLSAIIACLDAGHYRMFSFLPEVRARVVEEDELRSLDPDLRSFVNVNTPEEWAMAMALLQDEAL